MTEDDKLSQFVENATKGIEELNLGDHYYVMNAKMLTVDFRQSVEIKEYHKEELPFQFGPVEGSFSIANSNIRNLKGIPPHCYGSGISILGCELQSLQHHSFDPNFSTEIVIEGGHLTKIDVPINLPKGYIRITHTDITNLKDIHKVLRVRALRMFSNPIKSHVLGLLLIPELTSFTLDAYSINFDESLRAASKILQKHLDTRNILACQEDLIDAGLCEFAKL